MKQAEQTQMSWIRWSGDTDGVPIVFDCLYNRCDEVSRYMSTVLITSSALSIFHYTSLLLELTRDV